MTLLPSSEWGDLGLGFTTAFDAGGHESDQPVLVMAGFISSAKLWAEFSDKWNARLQQDGLKYFHAVELAHSTKQFIGWKKQEDRRRKLQSDLMEIIRVHALIKFGAIVDCRQLQEVPENYRTEFHIRAYSVAGLSCLSHVERWRRENMALNIPTENVFEDGDAGKGAMMKLLAEERFPEPIFRPKIDECNEDGSIKRYAFAPLQAADWLAYEYYIATKRVLHEKIPTEKLRWGIEAFECVKGTVRMGDDETALRITRDLDASYKTRHLGKKE